MVKHKAVKEEKPAPKPKAVVEAKSHVTVEDMRCEISTLTNKVSSLRLLLAYLRDNVLHGNQAHVDRINGALRE